MLFWGEQRSTKWLASSDSHLKDLLLLGMVCVILGVIVERDFTHITESGEDVGSPGRSYNRATDE